MMMVIWGPSLPGPQRAGRRWGLGPRMARALEGNRATERAPRGTTQARGWSRCWRFRAVPRA
eukprot:6267680-Alexandrium_andersonii.AAC.1